MILGGFVIRGFLGFKTLFLKFTSLLLTISSGLMVGVQGPLVHLSCSIGNVTTRIFKKYKGNDAKRREIMSAANEPDVIGKSQQINVTASKLKDYLGPEKYDVTTSDLDNIIGQATGLAWTPVGGDMLFIEVALTEGKGSVQLTGALGNVMKESAQAALTFVKANAHRLGLDPKKLQKTAVHIHVPEGAVPKDGPSAGVTITTAIVSAFTKIPVKREVAMTGEVTLRGRVLRIGGLKEKSIAAHRGGSKTILIPQENERDLVDIPDAVKSSIAFLPMASVEDVLKAALTKNPFQTTNKKRESSKEE